MSEDGVDLGRRHFLTVATTVTGGAGAVAVAVPFITSMRPSARAQALGAPVEVDVSKLESGAMLTVEWRGKPIYILNRSAEELRKLEDSTVDLRDPDSDEPQQPAYARNAHRSAVREYLVVIGVCTHLGCAPMFRPAEGAEDLGPGWGGGFFCPCHGSKFDLAGRVFAGVPAPLNLAVPPYRFISDGVILIGDDRGLA